MCHYGTMIVKPICDSRSKDKLWRSAHPLCMRGTKRTFIREWRKYRGLTLEKLADQVGITHGNLSRVERGLRPYSQTLLEALSDALKTEPASLLMRDPHDAEGVWTVWEKIPTTERARAIEVLKALAKIGT